MGFYEDTGILILGTRLKRLSERFLSEVGKIYESLNIEFESAWFPMVFLLYKKGPLSITEISEELKVSQPAASQLVSALYRKGFLLLIPDRSDKRKKMVYFTDKGESAIEELLPVWEILENSMLEIICHDKEDIHIVESFNQLESRLNRFSFSDSVLKKLKKGSEDAL